MINCAEWLYDLKKLKKDQKQAKILVLGLDNAGKTTILKFLGDEILQCQPIKGFNLKTLNFEAFKIHTWDIGGQRCLEKYRANYYEGADALIFVIDSIDKRRLPETEYELQKLLEVESLESIPLLILANKCDLEKALPIFEEPNILEKVVFKDCYFINLYLTSLDQISQQLNLDLIKDRQWSLVACSAKKNYGIKEGIEWLLSKM